MKLPGAVTRVRRPTVNPVLARELAQRMRGRQAWIVLVLYLGLLVLIVRMVYGEVSRTSSGGVDVLAGATAGRAIFHWLLFFMLALVCFIVPGVTAGAVSGERERQTLVSLQVTLLSPLAIVTGKLWSSLAYVLLLVVAALPLVGVTFVMGGVALGEVLAGLAMVGLTALALAAAALACSAVFRRTQGATVAAYAVTAALVVGTLVVYGFQFVVHQRSPNRSGSDRPAAGVLALNPFVATADVVRSRSVDRSLSSPFGPLQDLIGYDHSTTSVVVDAALADGPLPPDVVLGDRLLPPGAEPFGPRVGVVAEPEPRTVGGLRVWVASALTMAALALAAVALAVRRVTVPSQSGDR